MGRGMTMEYDDRHEDLAAEKLEDELYAIER
jgi:hypothetical protein